jgi:competence CoiA-like predicted nuclease
MPNPTIIHPNSTRTNHFLAITDFYIRIGQPTIYEVEPDLKHDYRPDAYTVLKNEHIAVEVQLSHTSNKKMQEKVDGFIDSHKKGKHAARKLWLVTDRPFKYKVTDGYQVEVIPLTEIKEKGAVI